MNIFLPSKLTFNLLVLFFNENDLVRLNLLMTSRIAAFYFLH
uniref:Uncharacterized protein n=1 Tax=Loigolactobacillus rennini TaxID=238013 RepID=A0A1K2I8N7_9LACO|nr:hypothetical protein LREN565_1791 [Loigolactobacillus rennini]